MLQVTRLEWQIASDEGFRPVRYKCTAGRWTIGYGTTYIHGEPVTADTPPISKVEARIYLKADILDAIDNCQRLYRNFSSLRTVHQEVLVCLAYQLGYKGLRGFSDMNGAIAEYDILNWKKELKDSLLYRIQAQNRVQRYLQAIDTEAWPT